MFIVRCPQCQQKFELQAVPTERKSFACRKCKSPVQVIPPSEPPSVKPNAAAVNRTQEAPANRAGNSSKPKPKERVASTKERKSESLESNDPVLQPPEIGRKKSNEKKPSVETPKVPAAKSIDFQEVAPNPPSNVSPPEQEESKNPPSHTRLEPVNENPSTLPVQWILIAVAALVLVGAGIYFGPQFFGGNQQTADSNQANEDDSTGNQQEGSTSNNKKNSAEKAANNANQKASVETNPEQVVSKPKSPTGENKNAKENEKKESTPTLPEKNGTSNEKKKDPKSASEPDAKTSPDNLKNKEPDSTKVDSKTDVKTKLKPENSSSEPPEKNVTETSRSPYGFSISDGLDFVGPDFAEQVEFPATPSPFVLFHHPFLGQYLLADLSQKQGEGKLPEPRSFQLDKENFEPKSWVSPDGKFVAGVYQKSGQTKRRLGVLDLASGKVVQQLGTLSGTPRFAEFLTSTELLVIEKQKGASEVSVWSVTDGESTAKFTLPPAESKYAAVPSMFAISPNREQLAYGTGDGVLQIVNCRSGDLIHKFQFELPGERYAAPKCLKFSNDGKRIVGWYKIGETGPGKAPHSQLLCWDLENKTQLQQHDLEVSLSAGILKYQAADKLVWLPDQSGWLAYGKWIIDFESGKIIAALPEPTNLFSLALIRPISKNKFLACYLLRNPDPSLPRIWKISTVDLPVEELAQRRADLKAGKAIEVPELPENKIPDVL